MKFKIESSEKDYTFNYFVYYKTSFLGKWKKLKKTGYMELGQCITAINDFKKANEKVKRINKELEDEI